MLPCRWRLNCRGFHVDYEELSARVKSAEAQDMDLLAVSATTPEHQGWA